MEPTYLLEATGMNLEVYDNKVVIAPKGVLGFLSKGTTGKKEIPFRSITGIECKEAGFAVGYIQFTLGGGNELRGGLTTAYADENTVTFGGALEGGNAAKNKLVLEIKDFIESKMEAIHTSQASPTATLGEEIGKLQELHAAGALSDEEFTAAKAKLIASD
jgi:hypothetical protein